MCEALAQAPRMRRAPSAELLRRFRLKRVDLHEAARQPARAELEKLYADAPDNREVLARMRRPGMTPPV